MKALTVRQPHAAAIVAGIKTIENRTRNTWHRGPLLIHAAKQPDPALPFWADDYLNLATPRQAELFDDMCSQGVEGHIIGVVDLVSAHPATPGCCDRKTGAHSDMAWHWELTDPHPVAWTPARGQLGLWNHDNPGAIWQETWDGTDQHGNYITDLVNFTTHDKHAAFAWYHEATDGDPQQLGIKASRNNQPRQTTYLNPGDTIGYTPDFGIAIDRNEQP